MCTARDAATPASASARWNIAGSGLARPTLAADSTTSNSAAAPVRAQVGVAVAQRGELVALAEPLERRQRAGKELDLAAQLEEDLHRGSGDARCGVGRTPAARSVCCIASRRSAVRSCWYSGRSRSSVARCARTSAAVQYRARSRHAPDQPLPGLALRAHQHRLDVPQRVVEVEAEQLEPGHGRRDYAAFAAVRKPRRHTRSGGGSVASPPPSSAPSAFAAVWSLTHHCRSFTVERRARAGVPIWFERETTDTESSMSDPARSRYDEEKATLRAKPRRWLVTGGAGFIGSHLLEELLALGQTVRVLDNLATGKRANVDAVLAAAGPDAAARCTFIEGDIADAATAARACAGVDFVLHQAALGSVPRSIADPRTSHRANVDGFLEMLIAARDAGVKRFVYASSSSVYGDEPNLPKVESRVGRVLSPYAGTKSINELYAGVFQLSYGLECIGLRYFNVFGPRQDPDGPYAAVIPKWVKALLPASRAPSTATARPAATSATSRTQCRRTCSPRWRRRRRATPPTTSPTASARR